MDELDSEIKKHIESGNKLDAVLMFHRQTGKSLPDSEKEINNYINRSNISESKIERSKNKTSINWILGCLLGCSLLVFAAILINKGLFDFHQDTRPVDQIEFENHFVQLQDVSKLNSANDVQRENSEKELRALINENRKIISWYGEVTRVEKTLLNGDGIIITSCNSEGKCFATYFLKDIRNVDLGSIKIGSKINFSGDFSGSDMTSLSGFVSAIFKNDRIMIQNASIGN